jgi:hypothetical protein
MLRTSRAHPQLLAYHVLEGAHDFNRVPWAPPGTRATIFNPPETRLTHRKQGHHGAHAPSMRGTSSQPPTTIGATMFIYQLPGAPEPPAKQRFTPSTAEPPSKPQWMRHAASPKTSSRRSKNYDNKTKHTSDATPPHYTSYPRFFRSRLEKL